MRLTPRDARLVRDAALSHALSRDQIIALGYFSSVTRANTRLRGLLAAKLLKRIETPFFGQGLYAAGALAGDLLGPNIGPLLRNRTGSPRFLQHALCVTNARIALLGLGAEGWRFEQQLWAKFSAGGKFLEARPDGLALYPGGRGLALEVDLGNVGSAKFRAKLAALDVFVASGEAAKRWGIGELRLLTVTTGETRARHLAELTPPACSFVHDVRPFGALGMPVPGSWS